jgi:deoxyadenosine/deoxycytidine kinase
MAELKDFFDEIQEGIGVILDKSGEMISGKAASDLKHLLADLSTLSIKIPKMFIKKRSEKIVAVVELMARRLDDINKDEQLKKNKEISALLTYINSKWNNLLKEVIKMIPKMERKPKADRVIIRLERFMRK